MFKISKTILFWAKLSLKNSMCSYKNKTVFHKWGSHGKCCQLTARAQGAWEPTVGEAWVGQRPSSSIPARHPPIAWAGSVTVTLRPSALSRVAGTCFCQPSVLSRLVGCVQLGWTCQGPEVQAKHAAVSARDQVPACECTRQMGPRGELGGGGGGIGQRAHCASAQAVWSLPPLGPAVLVGT